jgi:hypothetical protein
MKCISEGKLKKYFTLVFVGLSLLFIVTGCASTNYNRDLLMGIVWQQQSGEYPPSVIRPLTAARNSSRRCPVQEKQRLFLT